MRKSKNKTGSTRLQNFLNPICSFLFAVIAMTAIALAVLAQPLAQSFQDKKIIQRHEQFVLKLETLKNQQAELLANADNPAVIERAAVSNLNYLPVPALQSPKIKLTRAWPQLEKAIADIQLTDNPPAQTEKPYHAWIQTLADQPHTQNLLLLLGSALALVSLTCFNRQR